MVAPLAVRDAVEFVLTVWAQRRRTVGFLLGGLCEHRAEQSVAAPQQFCFEMAEVLVGGTEGVVELPAQPLEEGWPARRQEAFPVGGQG